MAAKKLTNDARRSDMWFLNPYDILIKENLRGRHTPPTEERIVNRAISMHENGQLQPVEVRREGESIVLVSGFTRAAAARLLRDGFTHEGVEYKDAEFMLNCKLVSANDKEAFIHNIVENAHRDETSPIDDAHNQRKLREVYGYTDAEIARLYQESPTTVLNKKKLLEHSDDNQKLVHEGKLAVSVAIGLLDLPPEERQSAIDKAVLSNGRVSGDSIRKTVRERHLRDEDSEKPQASEEADSPRYQKRTMKEIREFFDSCRSEVAEPMGSLCKKIVDWMDGKASDKGLMKAMLKTIGKE